MPSDFRTCSSDGVGDDWPISYEELAPFYDRIDVDFGVSGLNGDPAMPPQPDYPLPALPISPVGRKLLQGHAALGWHCWPGSNAIASRRYGALEPCVQLGVCGSGCPAGAKASVDITHWPIAEASGARLITDARVSRITHDAAGHANGAIFKGRDGVERRVSARIVMLAANAIGTPRILLSSRSPLFPNGLANGSGLVGKRLMLHPFSRAVGFFDEPMETWQGHWGQTVYSLEFAQTRPDRRFRARRQMESRPVRRPARRRALSLARRAAPGRSHAPACRCLARAHRRVGRHLRGSAGGSQSRRSARGRVRRRRQSGSSAALPHVRQFPRDDGVQPGAREGVPRRLRRPSHFVGRADAGLWLAPARHLPDGDRPCAIR